MGSSAVVQLESDRYRRITGPLHTILVLGIIAVWAYTGKINSDQMRTVANVNRVVIYMRTILLEWLVFALVILGVRLDGSPLRMVVGERWHSMRQVLRDIGIAATFWIVSVILLSIFGAHPHGPSQRTNIQFLLPEGSIEMALWVAMSVTAGICEEAVYRGYLQRQFMALTKNVPAGIFLSAAVFGTAHSYQGLHGAIYIGLQGVMLGILAHWRRSVRPGMISHAWNDVFAGVLARLLKIKVG